ncbi:DUF4181 domain-containing protein [Salinibacillus xinjiangensis]|uniref:DUF4181 domain-containing protein n=1 Tax=Salinibacillus xinjiangensis TaxID=1229268 RepID=A0A6G1X4M1_9BACI|nr:DUF4181 domain-containing protein [Salinibacillus xinjiangensis]MRG85869.1 DUF4181 domain-containing protein [Salinibacillus xinjiangensis]
MESYYAQRIDLNGLLIGAIILTLFSLLVYLFNLILRKKLKVKKRKLFAFNDFVNEKHGKIDWGIRIAMMIAIIVGSFATLIVYPDMRYPVLAPAFISFLFIYIQEFTRAYMEWKYSSNRNDFIYTLSSLGFISLLLLIVFSNVNTWL